MVHCGMTENRDQQEGFERYWRARFVDQARRASGVTEHSLHNLEQYHASPVEWTVAAMEIVADEAGASALDNILTRCACSYPEVSLEEVRELFRQTADLPLVHRRLQEQFLREIRPYKQLDNRHMQCIIDEGMGMAGTLTMTEEADPGGFLIRATKIPKEFRRWFDEPDRLKRRQLYCHCPRIRDAVIPNGESSRLSMQYCLCGAGFYRHLWEFVLERPVSVSVTEAVLTGGDHCRIEIVGSVSGR